VHQTKRVKAYVETKLEIRNPEILKRCFKNRTRLYNTRYIQPESL